MDRNFWISRWQENQIAFHQYNVNSWLERFFERLELVPGSKMLVPLCGKSLDMLWIAEQGMHVLGVELSPIAVESFFAENGMIPTVEPHRDFLRYRSGPVELLVGDFFELTSEDVRDVAAVYDRAAIVALPEPLRARYAATLGDLLPLGTRILLLSFEYPEGFRQGPPFSVTSEEIDHLFADRFAIDLLGGTEAGLNGMVEKCYLLRRR